MTGFDDWRWVYEQDQDQGQDEDRDQDLDEPGPKDCPSMRRWGGVLDVKTTGQGLSFL